MNEYEVRGLMTTRLDGTEDHLLGYWNFDSNTIDQSGKGNNGTIVGGASIVQEDQQVIGIERAVMISVTGNTLPYTKYRLEYSTNTLTGVWFDSGRVLDGSSSDGLLFDIIQPFDAVFYRVISDY